MILNELHQHVFKGRCGGITCNFIFLGDLATGDRFSTIFGDKYILALLELYAKYGG